MNDIKQEVFEIKQKTHRNHGLNHHAGGRANIPKIKAFREYQHIDRYHTEALENGKK